MDWLPLPCDKVVKDLHRCQGPASLQMPVSFGMGRPVVTHGYPQRQVTLGRMVLHLASTPFMFISHGKVSWAMHYSIP